MEFEEMWEAFEAYLGYWKETLVVSVSVVGGTVLLSFLIVWIGLWWGNRRR